mmetsp:Transcript_15746/g.33266  ORF Transcript_15746/g.33266 Transcript_15746/m.33266 type:complete len:404 (-) Transcript_15746:201-1412(-)
MAICFRVETNSDLSKIFAAHDLHSSILSDLFGRVLTPEDDYYTSPWAFLPVIMEDDDYDDGGDGGDGDVGDGIGGRGVVGGGFIVMTCRVPWLHGHGKHHLTKQKSKNNDEEFDNTNWQHQYFQRAREMMRECGTALPLPYIEMGPERMQHHLMLDENDIYTFTKDGCYPDANDISRALEDRAVEVTCAAMGWKVPEHWRRERERERAALLVDVFDLAKYDTANDANENHNDGIDHEKKIRDERRTTMGSSSGTKRKHSNSSGTAAVEPPRSKLATLISSPRYEGNYQREQHEEKKESLDHHVGHDTTSGDEEEQEIIDSRSTLIIPPPSSIHESSKQQQQHGEEEDGILHPETSSSSSLHVGRFERVEAKHRDAFYDDDAKNSISDENDPMDETRKEGRIEI